MLSFLFKGKKYSYPTSPSEITLSNRIEFHHQYGEAIDKDILSLESLDIDERKYTEPILTLEIACKSFSFFTGIPLAIINNEMDIAQVMNIYNSSLQAMLTSSNEETATEFSWNGETWYIAQPALTPQSAMTFNEFLVAKETVRQLESLGRSRWESLLYLCCIYLRKEGEIFNEELVSENGERMLLMKNLPLDIALSVGFFLSSTMNMFLKTSVFSMPEKAKA